MLFFLILVISITLLLGGCDEVPVTEYQLDSIYVDPVDISINSDSLRSRLCFDIKNNAKTTLVSQIEVTFDDIGKKCFNKIETKKMGEIPPKDKKHSCIDLTLKYFDRRDETKEECREKSISIEISLQDVNGLELDKGTVPIGII